MNVGQHSSFGIATRYGVAVRGSKPIVGEIFHTRPDQPWAHPASYIMGAGPFPGVKRPGRGADHQPSFITEVKGRKQLYL